MGIIDEFADAMKKVPWLKRLGETPDRVDVLERRLAAIEEKLGDTVPPDFCLRCGERAARLQHTGVVKDGVIQRWDCEKCHSSEFRKVRPR